ncbi:MAG: DoxX family protein [Legionellaceae bacterium]|nr:DoxX family protein [Legionellaceae bacterium]
MDLTYLTHAILLISPTLGAFLIGFYFAFFGVWNAWHWQATRDFMVTRNIPLPSILLTLGIFIQSIAGCLLMIGIYVQIAAIVLIPFNLIAVFIFHAFWMHEGELRRLNMIIFIANLTATLGALLLLLNFILPSPSLNAFLWNIKT